MKTIKFIISLAIVIIYLTSASAQTFYYVGEDKEPLQLIPNVKVILCEDTIKTPIHLEKGDSLIRKLSLDNSMAFVYREGEKSRTYERYSDMNGENACVYPAYRGTSGDIIAPTEYIGTILKNEADTILLKEICRKYGCVIKSRYKYDPTWYTLRIKPKPGSNPVILANTLQEEGHLESACPMFWMPNIIQISYDPTVKVGPLDEDNPRDNHYGYGLVNAYQAVINTPRPSKY